MNIYKNGNYTVTIMNDGTKIRFTQEDEFKPSFSENCDVKITDKCNTGCIFCYEGCSRDGKHANLKNYQHLIDSLHPYTEMALNGNDLDIPDFEWFLNELKNKHVFANVTVHQAQFMANYDYIKSLQEKGLLHGIGVSLSNSNDMNFISKLTSLNNTVLHVINGLFSEIDYLNLKDKNIKILFLGYKKLNRGDSYYNSKNKEIDNKICWLKDNICDVMNGFRVVSFDNLSLTQLDIQGIIPDDKWEEFYMGDDGGFTFYIDLVKGEFAKNSISQIRYPIDGKTIDEMFNIIKNNNNGF